MDMRFALIDMAATDLIMDAQRSGCAEYPNETRPHWSGLGRMHGESSQRRVSHRAARWRALPGIVAVWRLLPA